MIANKMDITRDKRWSTGRVYNYKDGLGKYDLNLEKAIKIAEKREGRSLVCGEEGWFLILEYLQKYITDAHERCSKIHEREKKITNAKYLVPLDIKTERLKDFVMNRISSILQRDGLDIDL